MNISVYLLNGESLSCISPLLLHGSPVKIWSELNIAFAKIVQIWFNYLRGCEFCACQVTINQVLQKLHGRSSYTIKIINIVKIWQACKDTILQNKKINKKCRKEKNGCHYCCEHSWNRLEQHSWESRIHYTWLSFTCNNKSLLFITINFPITQQSITNHLKLIAPIPTQSHYTIL